MSMNALKLFETGDDEPGGPTSQVLLEQDWRAACKSSIKDINHLSSLTPIAENEKELLKQVESKYHMLITEYYYSLVQEPYNPKDPVRMQCVPSADELNDSVHEEVDPLAEEETSPVPCLVHRYPDRVLLVVTGRCFMYCRHCTRKRLWDKNIPEPTLGDIHKAVSYIREHKEVREVIISGGDPLTLSTEKLDHILNAVSRCPNVEAMRIGTRAPVVLPQRVDAALCRMLSKYDNLWINMQFNHPREVTPESARACKRLQRCGIPLSNQSVLLRGVNDDPMVMMELCHKLQSIRVRPYYLYQCDPVVGANHFRTSVWKGVQIIEQMRGHTGGMCVPTFVVDGVGGKGKIPLQPNYVISMTPDSMVLRNWANETFEYHNPKV